MIARAYLFTVMNKLSNTPSNYKHLNDKESNFIRTTLQPGNNYKNVMKTIMDSPRRFGSTFRIKNGRLWVKSPNMQSIGVTKIQRQPSPNSMLNKFNNNKKA